MWFKVKKQTTKNVADTTFNMPKSVLVLSLFYIKGLLKLHHEIKIITFSHCFVCNILAILISLMNDLLKSHVKLCKDLDYTTYIAGVYFHFIQSYLLRTKNKKKINDTVAAL